jgi:uncharacterized protein YndB with AHSA1/START domain
MMEATMTATAQVSRLIPAKADKVWDTLTSKAGMKAWMMGADVDTDWKVGSPLTIRGEFNGKPFEDKGEVRSFEPGKRLSYTHQSGGRGPEHLVTIELAPKDGGAEVTITQANADGSVTEADREHKAQYEKTWAAMLEGVEKAAAN